MWWERGKKESGTGQRKVETKERANREQWLSLTRAQSRWRAPTTAAAACRAACRAREPRPPLPAAAWQRTRQMAPSVATRSRVHICSIHSSSAQAGQPSACLSDSKKAAVRGAARPVSAAHVAMSQSITGAVAGQSRKACDMSSMRACPVQHSSPQNGEPWPRT